MYTIVQPISKDKLIEFARLFGGDDTNESIWMIVLEFILEQKLSLTDFIPGVPMWKMNNFSTTVRATTAEIIAFLEMEKVNSGTSVPRVQFEMAECWIRTSQTSEAGDVGTSQTSEAGDVGTSQTSEELTGHFKMTNYSLEYSGKVTPDLLEAIQKLGTTITIKVK